MNARASSSSIEIRKVTPKKDHRQEMTSKKEEKKKWSKIRKCTGEGNFLVTLRKLKSRERKREREERWKEWQNHAAMSGELSN